MAAGFLAVAVFVAGFFAAVFLVAAGLVAVFFVVDGCTPAALAVLARFALRRAAVFFLIRPFLTALSSSLCVFDRVAALGFAANALVADLISFLIPTLRSRRAIVCFIRLIADLMIGTKFTSFTLLVQSKGDYSGKTEVCKE